MNKNALSYILIGSLCATLLFFGFKAINSEKYFRPEEVAKVDDYLYEMDEEGRIFVKNTSKPESKKNIMVEIEENKDKLTDVNVANVETGSIEELITIENENTKEKDVRDKKELSKKGEEYLNEIIDYRQKELEEENRKKEEERQKQLEAQEKEKIIYIGSDDLRKPSGLTSTQLERGLKHDLKGLGSAFVTAEKMYNVNAVFLASVAALESNWGRSNYARKRNNLFGYGAYTSNPDHAYYFESKEHAIYFVAKKLSEDYLTTTGKFFNGYTLQGVNKKYCTNPNWANSVGSIMREFY